MRAWAKYLVLLKQAGAAWLEDNCPSMGAALAYYSAFSLAPLLIIVIAIGGMAFGAERARAAIVEQFDALLGPAGAEALRHLLAAASSLGSGIFATVVGVALLLVGATSVLVELQSDLDRIWRAPRRRSSGWRELVHARVLSFGVLLGFGFLLLVSLLVGAGLSALAEQYRVSIHSARMLHLLNLASTLAVFMLLFAMLYKWLPNVRLAWRNVWVGALTTAVLFDLGQFGIGLYIGHSTMTSAYAAAGSFVVLLLWLYYSAQIFLFGAELTWVMARSGAQTGRAQPPSSQPSAS
jgi:membrane protein